MNKQTEALKLALEALEQSHPEAYRHTITAIREALAEQPAQQVDWEKLYRLEVKKKEALAAKYERDTGKKLTRIVPMAERPAQQQEPVAWMHTKIEGVAVPHRPADLDKHPDRWEALYKTPPPCPTCEALARTVMLDQTYHDAQRKPWVGLTDEEIQKIWRNSEHMTVNQVCRAIEAKLKEKNA